MTPNKPEKTQADLAVTAEQIRLLLDSSPDVIINLANAGLVALVLGPLYPAWALIPWLGSFCIVSFSRAILRHRYAMEPRGKKTAVRWERLFTLNALAAGCLWGLTASIVAVTSNSAYYNFVLFVLGGTMVGGIVCTASHFPSMLAFIVPAIGPAIAILALRGGLIGSVMALMLTLFTLAVVWTGRRINRSIVENARLRVEQEAMLFELRSSQAAMAEAQRLAQVGSWTIDLKASTTVWSEETYRIFGVDPATFIPSFEAFIEHIHPDDRKSAAADYAEILAKGTSPGLDHRIVMGDGSIRYVHEMSRAEYDSAGQPVLINGTIQDITARKTAEIQLQFANSMLKSEMQASPFGIMVADPHRKIVLFNRKLSEIWNVTQEEVPGKTLEEAIARVSPLLADPRKFAARVDHIFDHPEQNSRNEDVLADGRTIDSDVVTLLGSAGEYLGRVWYFRDITERRKAERKLAFTALLLKTQMEASLDGILIVDETKSIISFNRRFCDIWKIPLATLAAGKDAAVLAALAASVKDPPGFVARVEYLYDHPGEDSQEELEAADGKAIDRYAVTLYGPSREYLGRAWFFRDITERKRAEALALRIARYDVLTGLANRAVFAESLQHSIAAADRGASGFAVVYLDLDHFKDVNDTLGHPVGDELLKAVADRLRANTRVTDTVARFGGDEFAIIISDIGDPADAAILADKLLAALAIPFSIQGSDVHSGASIGIATYGSEAADAETLLTHADLALYRAKSEGRGGYRFFTGKIDNEVHMRVALGAELRIAIDAGQLFLTYQPQVEIASGRIAGLEALVRWRHPKRGILGPSVIIPIAEQMGVIAKLEHWVLFEACRQGKAWLEEGVPPVRISVNVSALQFRAPEALEADIGTTLKQTGFPPHLLELELTESVLVDAAHEHNGLLQRLRLSGVSFAIDDFGTRYSSLEYLRQSPHNRVKIARSFVANLDIVPADAAIVRAAIGLARELEIGVIADGVETQEQCDLLKKWGCGEVQGFHFAQPLIAVPLMAEEAASLLRTGNAPLLQPS
jgi:diguanylate cyclase (GGDEF)-like protein/PAS domain S-box-containing protein